MKPLCIAALVAVVALSGRSANAADDKTVSANGDQSAGKPTIFLSVTREEVPQGARPALLKSLYAASIGLQAYDGYSTYLGLRRGGVELNPAMQNPTPTTLIVAKATMTLTTIAIADQLWRQHHRGQAIAVMIISNGLMAAVAAKNASVVR